MHISSSLITVAAAASMAAAAPLTARQDRPITENFNLQAIGVHPPNPFNGSWIYSFHTGAGAGIAAASFNEADAMSASILPPAGASDGYQIGFTFKGNTGAPWYLNMEESGSTSGTATPTIGASNAPDAFGFYYTGDGLMWNNTAFAEWAICDGNFGVPQLYAVVNKAVQLPSTCASVNLMNVAALS